MQQIRNGAMSIILNCDYRANGC